MDNEYVPCANCEKIYVDDFGIKWCATCGTGYCQDCFEEIIMPFKESYMRLNPEDFEDELDSTFTKCPNCFEE